MAKVSVECMVVGSFDAQVTLKFSDLKPGRELKLAKLAADLSAALADGRLDLMEDIQLGMDLKAILS